MTRRASVGKPPVTKADSQAVVAARLTGMLDDCRPDARPHGNDVGTGSLVRTEKKRELIARLGNVEVYVLGVDNAGKPIAHWDLLEYWLKYFVKARSHVQRYSTLRDLR